MVFILKFTTSESDEQIILITSGGVCMCVGVTISPDIRHNFINLPATCSETDVSALLHVQCLHRQIGNINSLHSVGPQLYQFLALVVAPVCLFALDDVFMNNECSHGEILKVFIGYSGITTAGWFC